LIEIEKLIKQAKHGNKDSFTEAVLMVKDEAYKIAYCYLQDEQDSMDAVCGAVEKALNNIKKLRQPQYFKTWFIRITINESKKILRDKGKVIQLVEEMYTEEEKYLDNEGTIDLNNCLQELEPHDRMMIYLKYYQGYTLDEIADLVKIPKGTVRTRIYTNLKRLKEKLEVKEGSFNVR